jgi:site-specific DNA-cytosine methylase
LSEKTELLKDIRAKPFFAVLQTIRVGQPCMVILENVVGFLRVWKTASRLLRKTGPYTLHKIILCPSQLGSPCSRRRVYIIMLREDIVDGNLTCEKAAGAHMDDVLKKLKHDAAIPFERPLYPHGHEVFKARMCIAICGVICVAWLVLWLDGLCGFC